MKRSRTPSQSDIELHNRSRNDIICFASREIAVFLCCVAAICQIPAAVQWTCIGMGALLAVFSIVWDILLTLKKVKPIQGKFLWIIFSIQGVAITLLLFAKSMTSLILIAALIGQVTTLVITIIVRLKYSSATHK
jgi:uncharacterized membrane protein HdeD (DUF308 family)